MFRWLARFASLVCAAACGVPDTMEKPGTPFPSFSLKNHEGKIVSQEDIQGSKAVFWFYPKASTPG